MPFALTIEEALAILADPNETVLNCFAAEFGPEEAKQIAQALPKSQLTFLDIERSNIGDEGAMYIAKALPQSRVTTLYLNDNNIGDEGAAHLAQALPYSQVTRLTLGNNNIGDEGAAHIAKALPQSRVTTLYLNDNNIGDEGAAHLAQALPYSQVTRLSLDNNNIGDEGAAHIAKALPQSQVTRLSLDNNNIGDEGAAHIAKALPQSQVTRLDLMDNKINAAQEAVVRVLADAMWKVVRSKAAELKNLSGQVTAELWRGIAKFPAAVQWLLEPEQRYDAAQAQQLLDNAFQSASEQGFPVREFVLRTKPLDEALDYLDKIGQPARTAKDLLNTDGVLQEGSAYVAARLVSIPDAWESKAQAVHVRKQLPEALRDILPWQELYLALHRRTSQVTEMQR